MDYTKTQIVKMMESYGNFRRSLVKLENKSSDRLFLNAHVMMAKRDLKNYLEEVPESIRRAFSYKVSTLEFHISEGDKLLKEHKTNKS